MPKLIHRPKPMTSKKLRKPWEVEAAATAANTKVAVEINQWVADRLQMLRIERGMTHPTLALRMNVAESTVYRWERGITSLTPDILWQLSLILGTEPAYFFEGFGDPDRQVVASKIATILNKGSLAAVIGLNMLDRNRKTLAKQMIQALIENAGGKMDITGLGKNGGDDT